MTTGSSGPAASRQSICERIAGEAQQFDPYVDPRDEMMIVLDRAVGSRARFDYYRLGHELLQTVEQLADWAYPGERETLSLLEFACGYGRNLRHLVGRFPAGNVTASDIDADAVAFVSRRFGVRGLVSAAHPDALDWADRFDLVVVPSLFSHLPDRSFGPWLRFLYGLLTDRGVLALSVHDAALAPAPVEPAGITFVPESEAEGRLDTEEYGSTFVTEEYLARKIREAVGEARYARVPRGFWDHQDVYVVTGPRQRDPREFDYERPIVGHVDRVEARGNLVEVAGWARSPTPGLTVRVRAGETGREIRRFTPRADVAAVRGAEFLHSGFSATLEVSGRGREEPVVVVDAVAGELATCLYVGGPVRLPGRRATAQRASGAARNLLRAGYARARVLLRPLRRRRSSAARR